MTTDPDGEWLVSLNKLSKDRFLPVGPIMPDNDQLIHIGQGEAEMELVADHPAYPEPHDCVFAHKDKIDAKKVYDKDDYEETYITEEDSGVERTGENSVHVKMTTKRSEFGLPDFTVQEGDEVKLSTTNIEGVQDIIHALPSPSTTSTTPWPHRTPAKSRSRLTTPGCTGSTARTSVAPCTLRCAAG